MRYNADLYQLIKSLTKSEKRYFKVYSAQHTKKESNNYILLFDAIDGQEVYNEEKIKRKFKNHTFGKHLAKTKFLLYESIMKVLLQLRSGKDVGSKIRLLLDAVEFQYGKSLYDQAYISLQKAKKLVTFFEHYGIWIEVLEWEKKLQEYSDKMSQKQTLNSINKEYKLVKDLYSHEMNLAHLLQQVQSLAETANKSPMNDLIIELEVLFKNRLITKYKAKTFLSRLYALEIFTHEAKAVKDFEVTFLRLNDTYDLWQEHLEKMALFPYDFIRFCITYMKASISAKKKGVHYDELLDQMLKIHEIVQIDENKVFLMASMNDFIFNLSNENLEVCTIQLFTIKDLIEEHIHRLRLKDTITLYYHIGVFYFIKGEYRETLGWIEKIQNLDPENEFSNLQGYCHLLGLVSKYEEQELFQLDFELLKSYQFFDAKKTIHPVENIILTYIGRLINADHYDEEISLLTQFQNSLLRVRDRSLVYEMIANQAIDHWVKGKISNKDIPLLN